MTAFSKDRKMALLRLSGLLQSFHDTASDRSLTDEVRTAAATNLAIAMNNQFDLIIMGLRQAGGAARP